MYTLFIAVDANFKLKGKDRKLDDIDLSPGTGIFVEQGPYQEHISNYVEQPEVGGLLCLLQNLFSIIMPARLIHASQNMMPLCARASGQRLAMQSAVLGWFFVHGIRLSERTAWVTYKKENGAYMIQWSQGQTSHF